MTSYAIPLIHQRNSHTCWYACAQMVIRRYRQRRGLPQGVFSPVGRDIDTPSATQAVNRGNVHINLAIPGAVARVAEITNLSQVIPMARWPSPRPDNVDSWLATYGPLMFPGRPNGYRGVTQGAHMVLICGVTRTQPRQIIINDPAPGLGAHARFDVGTFFQQFTWIRGAPLLYAPRT